jgi:hypothetical protein
MAFAFKLQMETENNDKSAKPPAIHRARLPRMLMTPMEPEIC